MPLNSKIIHLILILWLNQSCFVVSIWHSIKLGHNEHSYWYSLVWFSAVLQVQPHISAWLCGIQAWQHRCTIDLIRSPFPLADRSWLEAPDVPYVILLPAAMQSGQSSMISTHWQLGMAKVPIGARGEEWQADTPNTALHTKGAAGTWAPEEKEDSRVLLNSGGKQCHSEKFQNRNSSMTVLWNYKAQWSMTGDSVFALFYHRQQYLQRISKLTLLQKRYIEVKKRPNIYPLLQRYEYCVIWVANPSLHAWPWA